ncbi:FeoA family protein [Streptomyces sp. GC420]|uniref:FeoA family protein n=1 Tax=Streptomyces sp. GC420 TaxID=2697568 RepID=UPI001414DC97|nr:FeoA family protein [Streptomyces sp. GC420]NBM20481.1 ferrous iron transport protein A [Streptomyces sp. GC420]
MVLGDCPVGTHVTLRSVTAHRERLRMAELGFVPGASIRVVSRSLGGRMVVAVGAARLALDGPTATAVSVEAAR